MIKEEWASYIINHADDSVTKILDFANTKDIPHNLLWECRFYVRQCLQWAESQSSFSINIIRFISHAIEPSSLVVKLSPPSMWRAFLNSGSDELDYSYYSFIFLLSFNWHNEYALLFLSHSLDRIYIALSKDQFPQKEWEKIEPFTENRGYIFEWDKCKRLCAGVVSYLKRFHFESEVIEKISSRNKIKKRLYKMW